MSGCRALNSEEIQKILEWFDHIIGKEEYDKWDVWCRNKTMFFMGLYSGMRISEMLSFTIGDVQQFGKIAQTAYLQKKNTKGKVSGRMIPINHQCRQLLQEYFDHYGLFKRPLERTLFESRTGGKISVRQVQNIYRIVFEQCQIEGAAHQLSTHSTRKTFASRVYESTNKDIIATQHALGHKALTSTQSYIMPNLTGLKTILNELDYSKQK